jgi:excisionase family DNA binding protein
MGKRRVGKTSKQDDSVQPIREGDVGRKGVTLLQRDGMLTPLLTVREAAAYLSVSEVTVRRLVKAGSVPHARVLNSIRFRVADLDQYLAERTSRSWGPEGARGRPRQTAKGGEARKAFGASD